MFWFYVFIKFIIFSVKTSRLLLNFSYFTLKKMYDTYFLFYFGAYLGIGFFCCLANTQFGLNVILNKNRNIYCPLRYKTGFRTLKR